MRLPTRYLSKIVIKRLIKFTLMNLFIFSIIFGAFTRSSTGLLYQLGDEWYIDSSYRYNHSYFRSYIGIGNPESFPQVLIPENNGTEVHFGYDTYTYLLNIPFHFPIFIRINSLELLPVYILRQSIFYLCISISIIVVITYLIINRRKFQITNKI